LEKYSQSNKIQWEFSKVEDADEEGDDDEGDDEEGGDEERDDEEGGDEERDDEERDDEERDDEEGDDEEGDDEEGDDEEGDDKEGDDDAPSVMKLIKPGSRYEIRVAGTNQYLGVPFLRHTVETCRHITSDSWLTTRCGDNWQIQLWRSDEYLTIPKYGAGRVSDVPTELSLDLVGGPNEIRITEVDSGRCWGGLLFEFYE